MGDMLFFFHLSYFCHKIAYLQTPDKKTIQKIIFLISPQKHTCIQVLPVWNTSDEYPQYICFREK